MQTINSTIVICLITLNNSLKYLTISVSQQSLGQKAVIGTRLINDFLHQRFTGPVGL